MPIPCSPKDLEQQISWSECPVGSGIPARNVKICNPEDISGGIGGSTVSLPGSANTTLALVPNTPGDNIDVVSIWNDGNRNINISFDGGITFHVLMTGEFLSQEVRGNITQVQLNTDNGSSDYRMIINFRSV